MGDTLVAKRYAKALFRAYEGDVTKAKQTQDTLQAVGTLFEDKKIRRILNSPAMPSDLKKELLDYAVDKGNGGENLKKFFNTVVQSGRVAAIPGIVKSFQQLINDAEGVVDAQVFSVAPLSESDMQQLAAYLEKIQNKKVKIAQNIDKTILGGFVVRVGNSLLDLSLRSKLDSIAQNAAR